jgi:DNA-directed RNA polymerase subunit H (RpoH/RPB5)
MTPDHILLDALDDALIAEHLLLSDDEVESVLDAVVALPDAVWKLLEAKRNAVVHATP